MRVKGGKRMQALSNKYGMSGSSKHTKASDRFDVRMEIARQTSENVKSLSDAICNKLLRNTLNEIYGRKKR